MFMNPPVRHFSKVVPKIQKTRCKAVVVLPNLPGEQWYDRMWTSLVDYYYYGPDKPLFLLEGHAPEWRTFGVWALYMDGAANMTGGGKLEEEDADDRGKMLPGELKVRKTTGWKRRNRRRTLEKNREEALKPFPVQQ